MRTPLIFLTLVALAFISSCSEQQQDDRSQPDELFARTVEIVKTYTDSLHSAPDTAAIARLTDSYEAAVTKLNLSYPPETDMRMTEGQQDSIWRYTRKFLEVKRSRIRHLVSHKCDTIEPDSTGKAYVKKI